MYLAGFQNLLLASQNKFPQNFRTINLVITTRMINNRSQDNEELLAEDLFDLQASQIVPVVAVKQLTSLERNALAHNVLRRASYWSIPVGFIPIPILNILCLAAVQIILVFNLCRIYGISFEKKSVYAVICALLSATIAGSVTEIIKKFILESTPVLGTVIALIIQPALCYMMTLAIGRVFIVHIKSQKDLNNFDDAGHSSTTV